MPNASRLDVAADKLELLELVTAYCRAVDRRDVALMRTLYHPDAIDDHGALFYGTGEEFIQFLPGALTTFAITTHHITNALFHVDGDYAQGESYLIAGHITQESPPRNLIVSGRYLDKFERRDDVWRFSHRTAMLDWANLPVEDIVKLLPPRLDRAGAVGAPDHTDPSYSLLSMFGPRSPGD
jgi:hypothetical protein